MAVTVLLYAKSWLHNLVTSVISKDELDDALIFAAATLVVLPLVPNRQIGPYLALNPHSIWIVIVLVMAISAAGYVAVRLFGAKFGLPLAGAISGFISSTATIGAMGSRAKKSPDLLAACVAGAVLSTVATIAQMALVVAATSMPTLISMSGSLLLAGGTALAYGAVFTLLAARNSGSSAAQTGGVFSLKTALAFGLILAVILVISAALQERFGGAGVLLAAVVGTGRYPCGGHFGGNIGCIGQGHATGCGCSDPCGADVQHAVQDHHGRDWWRMGFCRPGRAWSRPCCAGGLGRYICGGAVELTQETARRADTKHDTY